MSINLFTNIVSVRAAYALANMCPRSIIDSSSAESAEVDTIENRTRRFTEEVRGYYLRDREDFISLFRQNLLGSIMDEPIKLNKRSPLENSISVFLAEDQSQHDMAVQSLLDALTDDDYKLAVAIKLLDQDPFQPIAASYLSTIVSEVHISDPPKGIKIVNDAYPEGLHQGSMVVMLNMAECKLDRSLAYLKSFKSSAGSVCSRISFQKVRPEDLNDIALILKDFPFSEVSISFFHDISHELNRVQWLSFLRKIPRGISSFSLENIHLGARDLPDSQSTRLEALVDEEWCKELKKLSLRNCFLSQSQAQVLASVEWKHILFLDLSDNSLNSKAIENLVSSKTLSKVKYLVLGNNNIGNRGAAGLAKANCPDLKYLDLSHNNIGEEGIVAVAQGSLTTVSHLNLSGNRKIDETTVRTLANGTLASLTWLNLDEVISGAESCAALATGNLTNLRHLSLRRCNIGNLGFEAISSGNFLQLEDLDVASNWIGNQGVVALTKGRLKKLKHLGLAENYEVSGEAVEALTKNAFWQFQHLTRLNLNHTEVRSDDALEILSLETSQSKNRFPKLQDLHLERCTNITDKNRNELIKTGKIRKIRIHFEVSEKSR